MTTDPKKFKAPYIPKEEAWRLADKTREKYWPSGEVPVDVEMLLWPMKLKLVPFPSFSKAGDVDALLLGI